MRSFLEVLQGLLEPVELSDSQGWYAAGGRGRHGSWARQHLPKQWGGGGEAVVIRVDDVCAALAQYVPLVLQNTDHLPAAAPAAKKYFRRAPRDSGRGSSSPEILWEHAWRVYQVSGGFWRF